MVKQKIAVRELAEVSVGILGTNVAERRHSLWEQKLFCSHSSNSCQVFLYCCVYQVCGSSNAANFKQSAKFKRGSHSTALLIRQICCISSRRLLVCTTTSALHADVRCIKTVYDKFKFVWHWRLHLACRCVHWKRRSIVVLYNVLYSFYIFTLLQWN